MTPSPLTAIYGNWTRPSYERRVRATAKDPTFLWGSAGLTQNFGPDKDLVLHIRNDTFGQQIVIGTQVTSATKTQTQTPYGSLNPAECVSISLQGLSGVYATCETESVVACLITL
jgi:hypothetical protein